MPLGVTPVAKSSIKAPIKELETAVQFSGNLNDSPYGVFYFVNDNCTNYPPGLIAGGVCFFVGGFASSTFFGIQICIGYDGSQVFMRRNWGGWDSWRHISVV